MVQGRQLSRLESPYAKKAFNVGEAVLNEGLERDWWKRGMRDGWDGSGRLSFTIVGRRMGP